ncbi:hypothetical protein GEMRC1_001596 [Eukaryota sp. GEM-RC1]
MKCRTNFDQNLDLHCNFFVCNALPSLNVCSSISFDIFRHPYTTTLFEKKHSGSTKSSNRKTLNSLSKIQQVRDDFSKQSISASEKIRKLASSLQDSFDINNQLSTELSQSRKALSSASERINNLEDTIGNLRSGLLSSVAVPKPRSERKKRQDRVYKELTNEVLHESRPSTSFQSSSLPKPDRSVNSGLQVRVKKLLDEQKTLTRTLTEKDQSLSTLRNALAKTRSTHQKELSKLQSQLIGAARRVAYLVSKNKELTEKLSQRDQYIKKIEALLFKNPSFVSKDSPVTSLLAASAAQQDLIQSESPLSISSQRVHSNHDDVYYDVSFDAQSFNDNSFDESLEAKEKVPEPSSPVMTDSMLADLDLEDFDDDLVEEYLNKFDSTSNSIIKGAV